MFKAWQQACSDFDPDSFVHPSLPEPDPRRETLENHPPAFAPRGPGPRIIHGLPITEYSPEELVALARWIYSDTLLRTDDDMHKEMRSHLGFKRGGSRINPAIQRAIDEARRT